MSTQRPGSTLTQQPQIMTTLNLLPPKHPKDSLLSALGSGGLGSNSDFQMVPQQQKQLSTDDILQEIQQHLKNQLNTTDNSQNENQSPESQRDDQINQMPSNDAPPKPYQMYENLPLRQSNHFVNTADLLLMQQSKRQIDYSNKSDKYSQFQMQQQQYLNISESPNVLNFDLNDMQIPNQNSQNKNPFQTLINQQNQQQQNKSQTSAFDQQNFPEGLTLNQTFQTVKIQEVQRKYSQLKNDLTEYLLSLIQNQGCSPQSEAIRKLLQQAVNIESYVQLMVEQNNSKEMPQIDTIVKQLNNQYENMKNFRDQGYQTFQPFQQITNQVAENNNKGTFIIGAGGSQASQQSLMFLGGSVVDQQDKKSINFTQQNNGEEDLKIKLSQLVTLCKSLNPSENQKNTKFAQLKHTLGLPLGNDQSSQNLNQKNQSQQSIEEIIVQLELEIASLNKGFERKEQAKDEINQKMLQAVKQQVFSDHSSVQNEKDAYIQKLKQEFQTQLDLEIKKVRDEKYMVQKQNEKEIQEILLLNSDIEKHQETIKSLSTQVKNYEQSIDKEIKQRLKVYKEEISAKFKKQSEDYIKSQESLIQKQSADHDKYLTMQKQDYERRLALKDQEIQSLKEEVQQQFDMFKKEDDVVKQLKNDEESKYDKRILLVKKMHEEQLNEIKRVNGDREKELEDKLYQFSKQRDEIYEKAKKEALDIEKKKREKFKAKVERVKQQELCIIKKEQREAIKEMKEQVQLLLEQIEGVEFGRAQSVQSQEHQLLASVQNPDEAFYPIISTNKGHSAIDINLLKESIGSVNDRISQFEKSQLNQHPISSEKQPQRKIVSSILAQTSENPYISNNKSQHLTSRVGSGTLSSRSQTRSQNRLEKYKQQMFGGDRNNTSLSSANNTLSNNGSFLLQVGQKKTMGNNLTMSANKLNRFQSQSLLPLKKEETGNIANNQSFSFDIKNKRERPGISSSLTRNDLLSVNQNHNHETNTSYLNEQRQLARDNNNLITDNQITKIQRSVVIQCELGQTFFEKLDYRTCLRCGLNDKSAPFKCQFHPFKCKNKSGPGKLLYSTEWHQCREKCKENGSSTDVEIAGCMKQEQHYYGSHLPYSELSEKSPQRTSIDKTVKNCFAFLGQVKEEKEIMTDISLMFNPFKSTANSNIAILDRQNYRERSFEIEQRSASRSKSRSRQNPNHNESQSSQRKSSHQQKTQDRSNSNSSHYIKAAANKKIQQTHSSKTRNRTDDSSQDHLNQRNKQFSESQSTIGGNKDYNNINTSNRRRTAEYASSSLTSSPLTKSQLQSHSKGYDTGKHSSTIESYVKESQMLNELQIQSNYSSYQSRQLQNENSDSKKYRLRKSPYRDQLDSYLSSQTPPIEDEILKESTIKKIQSRQPLTNMIHVVSGNSGVGTGSNSVSSIIDYALIPSSSNFTQSKKFSSNQSSNIQESVVQKSSILKQDGLNSKYLKPQDNKKEKENKHKTQFSQLSDELSKQQVLQQQQNYSSGTSSVIDQLERSERDWIRVEDYLKEISKKY